MNKEIVLPSGAKLYISLAPFADSRALYQAICEEAKGLNLDPKLEIDTNLYKDMFCAAISSKKIESCLEKCLERCTYNGKTIKSVQDVFESVEARGDYLTVCFEVAKENVLPFMKSLYARFEAVLAKLKPAQA